MGSLVEAEATHLSWPQARDKEEAGASGAVSFGDGGGGVVGSSAGVARATPQQGWLEEWPAPDAAEDDAGRLLRSA